MNVTALQKVLASSRSSGTINLANKDLREVPSQLLQLDALDYDDKRWWEEAELAKLQAAKFEAGAMTATRHSAQSAAQNPQPAARPWPAVTPVARDHTAREQFRPQAAARPQAATRPAPQTWGQSEAKRSRPAPAPAGSAPLASAHYSHNAGPHSQPAIQPIARHEGMGHRVSQGWAGPGHALNILQKMAGRLAEKGPVAKGLLIQYAGDMLYEVSQDPNLAAASEEVFHSLYDRIMAESHTPNLFASWDAQEVKTFFEVGIRFKKGRGRGLQRFKEYVDMLNLFVTKPVELGDVPVVPDCWLRPTVAAALMMSPQHVVSVQV